ncbi:MAG: hypothetical protein [Olavius algarvensis Gamma 1 endosymbiont]|nr:MAG: hypothetical protein [Olavius algarvensis Gamma 1 endosymbiont]
MDFLAGETRPRSQAPGYGAFDLAGTHRHCNARLTQPLIESLLGTAR